MEAEGEVRKEQKFSFPLAFGKSRGVAWDHSFFFITILFSPLFFFFFFFFLSPPPFFFTKIKLKPQRPPRFSSTFTKGVTAPGFSTSPRFRFPHFPFPPPTFFFFRLFFVFFFPKLPRLSCYRPPSEGSPSPAPVSPHTPVGCLAPGAAVLTGGRVPCAPLRAPPRSGRRAHTGRRSGTEVTTGCE